jgi:hypothetical protein
MNVKMFLAASAAVLVLPTTAVAAGTTVSVRIEGKTRTLLPATRVRTHSGSITRFGAPKGECPATSAQGALDVATNHRWKGIWSTQFGPEYEITSVLGETHSFSSKYFWEIFVNNVSASTGACEIALHRGEHLLFAVAPSSGGPVFPLSVIAPDTAAVGHPFTVKVIGYDAKGRSHPLRGAEVDGKRTDSHGTAQIDPTSAGRLTLRGTKTGYIRDAVTVRVA